MAKVYIKRNYNVDLEYSDQEAILLGNLIEKDLYFDEDDGKVFEIPDDLATEFDTVSKRYFHLQNCIIELEPIVKD
jgi:hypothetical protein